MRLAKIFLVVARPSPIAFVPTGEESETACNRPANDNLHDHGVPGGHLVKNADPSLVQGSRACATPDAREPKQ